MDYLLLTVFYLLPYLAMVVFVYGVVSRILRLRQVPSNLFGPIQDISTDHPAIPGRRWLQALTIGSPRRRGFVAWLLILIFHYVLLVVMLRHFRFIIKDVPEWGQILLVLGPWPGWLLTALILALTARRLLSRPLAYVSGIRDFLPLILLLAVCASGLALRYLAPADLVEVKTIMLGLTGFLPYMPTTLDFFSIHFVLALILVAWVPYSRLFHGLAMLLASPADFAVINTDLLKIVSGPGITARPK